MISSLQGGIAPCHTSGPCGILFADEKLETAELTACGPWKTPSPAPNTAAPAIQAMRALVSPTGALCCGATASKESAWTLFARRCANALC